jgi:hypothetical protein
MIISVLMVSSSPYFIEDLFRFLILAFTARFASFTAPSSSGAALALDR